MAENASAYSPDEVTLNDTVREPLPYNELNEYSLLIALLESDDTWDEYGALLAPVDFLANNHRVVFQEMKELAAAGGTLTAFQVASRISERFSPDHPAVQLAAQMHGQARLGDPRELVRLVQNDSIRRKLISELKASIANVHEVTSDDVNDLIESILHRVDAISSERLSDEDVAKSSLPVVLSPVLEEIDYIREHGHPRKYLNTGFKSLNEYSWGGFRPGHLIVLAGRPGMGKTSLALNIGENVLFHNDKETTVLFLSLEQRAEEIGAKLLSSTSQVPFGKLKQHRLRPEEEQAVVDATNRIQEYLQNFIIMNPNGLTINDLIHIVKQVKRAKGRLDLVVVDYVGLMQPAPKSRQESRALEIAEITRGLKNLANHESLPILALAQLNRNAASRIDKRPRLSDLRDSGSIEQDADMVMMLHRDERDQTQGSSGPNLFELIISKNRHGPMGMMNLKFHEQITVFEEPLSEDPEDLPGAQAVDPDYG